MQHPARRIRLNTERVKKPKECLEYVVVHEMVHLLEASHNACLPVRYEEWDYRVPRDCFVGGLSIASSQGRMGPSSANQALSLLA